MMDESIQLDASEHVETSEYPRKTNITMENHIFFWVNQLYMAIFNGHVCLPEGTCDRKQNPTRNSGTLLLML